MSTVISPQFRLLGSFHFFIEEEDISAKLTARDKVLLAYLCWKNGVPLTRERLIEDLWPDLPPERALRALNTALWRLRCAIRNNGYRAANVLCTSNSEVSLCLDASNHCDAVLLEKKADWVFSRKMGPMSDNELDDLKATVQKCRGSFLPDCYDDWSHLPREILRSQFDILEDRLIQELMRRALWRQAICFALPVVELDPTHEMAHRWLIQAFLALGERARAKVQLETLTTHLRKELGVEPLPETRALLEDVEMGKTSNWRINQTGLKFAIQKLDVAREAMVQLRTEF